MTPAEAFELIQEHVSFGRIHFTTHALWRMEQRDISRRDVHNAIETAPSCQGPSDGTWKLTGQDKDGDNLTVIVSIEGSSVIITVY